MPLMWLVGYDLMNIYVEYESPTECVPGDNCWK